MASLVDDPWSFDDHMRRVSQYLFSELASDEDKLRRRKMRRDLTAISEAMVRGYGYDVSITSHPASDVVTDQPEQITDAI